ncbi:hypothetical protein [Dyella caseinilytica]|uniref:Uncharacterized protein n=1 Tax=Dyella caseinilytica TaxID=1849581 RepID=A0ABX7GXF1_9GAMM|nr:hypothetical protein [Dyella caseinilytica]QRN54959.1 hypothetical protein ISN74_06330 [Dyella caseinilytica]GFZ98239.1 hypothetical protein GCM10011408_18540 [Dyella caseinilytica]
MSRTQGSLVRNAVLVGFIALGLTSTAIAQTASPATGLGASWPNAADVSAASNWHVYVFRLHGIKYVQINDLGGTVHAAIGTANGTTIVLPVGVDAQNVTTTATAASSTAQVVYHDASTTITATPQSSGATTFAVKNATQSCPEADCSGSNVIQNIP